MIYYFGDSHTAGMGGSNPLIDYVYNPYPHYLSEKLNMEYVNLAKPGNNLVYNVNLLIKNLKSIIDNGKIVIFQFQFFQNAFFRFEELNLQWKDFVIGKNEPIDELLNKYNLKHSDGITLLNYLDKFEERRSWYEMEKVYSIFDLLETYDIKCYALFWSKPNIINIIDDKRNIVFDNKKYVQQLAWNTINEETDGKWNDGHMSNTGNLLLAEKIHTYILNS
jgi:hypothetical protein